MGLIIGLVMVFAQYATAQSRPLTQYLPKDGLPGSVVFDTYQDERGFIWIGTNYGLCRFDGQEFIHITNDSNLRFRDVIKIIPGEKGQLYALIYKGGVFRFDPSGELPLDLEFLPLPDLNNLAILPDQLVSLSWGKLSFHQVEKDGVKTTTHNVKFGKKRTPDNIFLNGNNEILLGAQGGLFKWENDRIVPYLSEYFEGLEIQVVRSSPQGQLWVAEAVLVRGHPKKDLGISKR